MDRTDITQAQQETLLEIAWYQYFRYDDDAGLRCNLLDASVLQTLEEEKLVEVTADRRFVKVTAAGHSLVKPEPEVTAPVAQLRAILNKLNRARSTVYSGDTQLTHKQISSAIKSLRKLL